MLRQMISVSLLIVVVLLVRTVFRNQVPKRLLYALWIVVLVKLLLPGTLLSLPVLPAQSQAAPTQTATAAQTETPAVQQPTSTQPTPQQPLPQLAAAARANAAAWNPTLVFQTVWAVGSGTLTVWMALTWVSFNLRLRRTRRKMVQWGSVSIYVSTAAKAPCLAGFLPAVYLTEDAARSKEIELIVQHELTHLRHLDFLWSACGTLAVIAYWWNPLVWIAAVCAKRDAELACDETVAAKLDPPARLVYARTILAQLPCKNPGLSLAGRPVKARILFLTKKQRSSALCMILALVLTVFATGCSVSELTRRESETADAPQQASLLANSQDQGMQETPEMPQTPDTSDAISLPTDVAAWASANLPDTFTVLASQSISCESADYLLLLAGTKQTGESSYTGYQAFALQAQDGGYQLYAWSEVQRGADDALLACAMKTDDFSAVYGVVAGAYDAVTVFCSDGSQASAAIESDAPFLQAFPGRGKTIEDVAFTDGSQTIRWSEHAGAGLQSASDADAYSGDGVWERVHSRLAAASWDDASSEEAIQQFQLADSKVADGTVSQWPRYYAAFVTYFAKMQADLHYLAPDAVWTLSPSEGGQTMAVTMVYGDASQTLVYSLDGQISPKN